MSRSTHCTNCTKTHLPPKYLLMSASRADYLTRSESVFCTGPAGVCFTCYSTFPSHLPCLHFHASSLSQTSPILILPDILQSPAPLIERLTDRELKVQVLWGDWRQRYYLGMLAVAVWPSYQQRVSGGVGGASAAVAHRSWREIGCLPSETSGSFSRDLRHSVLSPSLSLSHEPNPNTETRFSVCSKPRYLYLSRMCYSTLQL